LATLLAACGTRTASSTTQAAGASTTTTATATTDHLVYFVPGWLPAGFKVSGAFLSKTRDEPASWGAALGRRAGDEFSDLVHVTVVAAETDREVSADDQVEPVTINGHRARYQTSSALGQSSLDWFQDGLAIGLIGGSNARDVLVATAKKIAVSPDHAAENTKLASVPSGFELIGSFAYPTSARANYVLTAMGGVAQVVTISVVLLPGSNSLDAAPFSVGTSSLRAVDACGTRAYVSTQQSMGPRPLTQISLACIERGRLAISVQGTLSEAEAVQVANGLEERTEAEWRAEVPVRES
jgi:hypothetical protein